MDKRSPDEVIAFRASREDREAIRQVSDRLGLNQSEVSRRAVRLGLPILDAKSTLPGSSVQLRHAK